MVTTYTYDSAGQLAGTDYSDATTDVAYTYDRLGRQATVTDGAGTREFTYAAAGGLAQEAWTAGALNGFATAYTYDALGRRATLAVKQGQTALQTTAYAYDGLSRLASVGDGTHRADYAYRAAAPGEVEGINFYTGETAVTGTVKTFDRLRRLASVLHRAGGVALPVPQASFAYTHNAARQRVRVDLADASYWEYTYDALGQVTGWWRWQVELTTMDTKDPKGGPGERAPAPPPAALLARRPVVPLRVLRSLVLAAFFPGAGPRAPRASLPPNPSLHSKVSANYSCGAVDFPGGGP